MKRRQLILLPIIILMSFLVLCACGEKGWSSYKLSSLFPEPKDKKIEVITDSKLLFQAELSEYSMDEYDEYVAACKEKGFSNNIIEENDAGYILGADPVTDTFSASNDDGYLLELKYKDSLKQMEIILSAE
ncbi:MAG: hypothetical protein MJ086_06045 [Lachnospiraceae bacterium]|nr:hypothetical protein [Lachnospiraceae bacterium]